MRACVCACLRKYVCVFVNVCIYIWLDGSIVYTDYLPVP